MKILTLSLSIFLLVAAMAGAQSHTSVSVEETDLYRLLEVAEISGIIDPLPAVRPLPLSLVKKALNKMKLHWSKLSSAQQQVLTDYVERFVDNEDKPFIRDAELRYNDDLFPISWRFYAESDAHMDLADTGQVGIHNIFGGILGGDLGKHISYGLNINAQLNKVNIDNNAPYPYAWAPYTYTKRWDGGARFLSDPSPQVNMPTKLALGWAMYPEIDLSFWNNKADLRFGRMRRDWGFGEGNLFLNEQARPLLGFEGTLTPWKPLSFSFLFGSIEYGPSFRNSPFETANYPSLGSNDSIGIQEVSRYQQNMLSIFLLELRPTKWLYFGIYDAAIYLKRFELGYMMPFMSRLLAQNNIGDFDNLLFGGTLAFQWPGLFRLYSTVLLDEWNPTIALNSLRNQFAVQIGLKTVLPLNIWSLLTLQYTKIEPFTYTHYAVDKSPWYYSADSSLEMETGYLNGGENLGSYLEPNSDEFLIAFHTQPARGWSMGASYRFIRHGGPDVNGSSYDSWGYAANGGVDDDPNGAYYKSGTKDFLHDGLYEWFHIFSLGTSVDIRNFPVPLRVGLQYNFVYEFDTDFSANNNFTPVEGSEIFRHLIGLNLQLWMK